jgi:hypothetical protein
MVVHFVIAINVVFDHSTAWRIGIDLVLARRVVIVQTEFDHEGTFQSRACE